MVKPSFTTIDFKVLLFFPWISYTSRCRLSTICIPRGHPTLPVSMVCSPPSVNPTDQSVHAARGSAPPHHIWYEVNVRQIVAAELQAQDKGDTEALMLLTTSLQVRSCIEFERATHCNLVIGR